MVNKLQAHAKFQFDGITVARKKYMLGNSKSTFEYSPMTYEDKYVNKFDNRLEGRYYGFLFAHSLHRIYVIGMIDYLNLLAIMLQQCIIISTYRKFTRKF